MSQGKPAARRGRKARGLVPRDGLAARTGRPRARRARGGSHYAKEGDPPMPAVSMRARRGARTLAALAVAAGLSLVGAAPAAALPLLDGLLDKNTALSVLGCNSDHDARRPLSAWIDFNDYALAPGGDFESRASGWTLRGNAAVTGGNQPFDIGTGGRASLRLADGASVTSPAMCIDDRYPHFRLFARNNGSAKGIVKAEVLFLNL